MVTTVRDRGIPQQPLQTRPGIKAELLEEPHAKKSKSELEAKLVAAAQQNAKLRSDWERQLAIEYARIIATTFGEERALKALSETSVAQINTVASGAYRQQGKNGTAQSTALRRLRKREFTMSHADFKAEAKRLAEENPDLSSDEKRIKKALDAAMQVERVYGKTRALELLRTGTLGSICRACGIMNAHLRGMQKVGSKENDAAPEGSIVYVLKSKPGFTGDDYKEASRIVETLAEWLNSEDEALMVLRESDSLAEFRVKAYAELKEAGVSYSGHPMVEQAQRKWREKICMVVSRLIQEKYGERDQAYDAKRAMVNAIIEAGRNPGRIGAILQLADSCRGPNSLLVSLNGLMGAYAFEGRPHISGETDVPKGYSLEEVLFFKKVCGMDKWDINELAGGDKQALRKMRGKIAEVRANAKGVPAAEEHLALVEMRFGINQRIHSLPEMAKKQEISASAMRQRFEASMLFLRDFGKKGKNKKTETAEEIVHEAIAELEAERKHALIPRRHIQLVTDKKTTGTSITHVPAPRRKPDATAHAEPLGEPVMTHPIEPVAASPAEMKGLPPLDSRLGILGRNGDGDQEQLRRVLLMIQKGTSVFDFLRRENELVCDAVELRFGLSGGAMLTAEEAAGVMSGKRHMAAEELSGIVQTGIAILQEGLLIDALTGDGRIASNLRRRQEAIQRMDKKGILERLRESEPLAHEILKRRYLTGNGIATGAEVAEQLKAEGITDSVLLPSRLLGIEKQGTSQLLEQVNEAL